LNDTYESPAVEKVPFEMGFSHLPVMAEVAVTYRCNAACIFCYAGCNCTTNPINNETEMTLEEVREVLRKIRIEAQVPSVSFTGGEATLRPDLPEMVAAARSLGMRVNLITNGTRCNARLVQQLVEAGLHSAQVSLEGTTAEVHEAITRIRGSHRRAMQGVHHFREAGIVVHTNTTITQTNLHDAVRFPAFVKHTLGLDTFSMNLVIPTGTASLHDAITVRYDQIAETLTEILAESQRQGVAFKWYSPTPMCLFNPILHGLGNKGCAACDGLLSVGADGQVLPCASYDQPVGDLLQSSFSEIWNGPKATAFRQKDFAHDICKACEQFSICNGACPLYWRQCGYDELFQAHRSTSADPDPYEKGVV
ncbi:MAG: radical SAM protein, partial [Anaerolineae bacterium]|nr:radical SAM protein [Anaerolineae bacterium]